jgi:hypothetical protein
MSHNPPKRLPIISNNAQAGLPYAGGLNGCWFLTHYNPPFGLVCSVMHRVSGFSTGQLWPFMLKTTGQCLPAYHAQPVASRGVIKKRQLKQQRLLHRFKQKVSHTM